jgi:hypothetical protein
VHNHTQVKVAYGELCHVENGENVENTLLRHERRMENSQSDKYQRNQMELASEEDEWELKFDLDEMLELFTMSTRPYVKGLSLSFVDEQQNRMNTMKCDLTEKLGVVKKMV